MRKTYETPAMVIEKLEVVDCIAISHTFNEDGIEIPIDDILPGQSPEELLSVR